MPSNKEPNRPKSTDELHWLETYFIVFPEHNRPTIAEVQRALTKADPRLVLENLAGDDEGRFQSVLVESPEDHAAVEISFETGEAVIEQNLEWAKTLQKDATASQLQHLLTADARLDVAHFERLPGGAQSPGRLSAHPSTDLSEPLNEFAVSEAYDESAAGEDEFGDPEMEMLDPTCLLIVVDTLSRLTKGLAFDPASGEMV